MFAVAEYEAYRRAQNRADELYRLEQLDESFAMQALDAQDEADRLYDDYEYAAGLKILEDDC